MSRLAHLVLLALGLVGLAAAPAAAQQANVTWRGWSFVQEVNGNSEGLSLRNVTFNGRTILRKISMPVVRVFYTGNACGPYADRLGGTLAAIPWAGNATLAQRSFTINGQDWYEIGIRDFIGNYDLYQVYYLSADGILEAHLYSRGLQCVVDHVHYPNWRMDFLLDGATGNLVERNAGTGFTTLATEFNAAATSAQNHAWRVRNPSTGLLVDVLPGFADFRIPDGSAQVPVTAYDRNTVFARQYRGTEDIGWTVGPNVQVPYGNGEALTDPVLWYEGYMPHLATEGQALWHSTGVRLVTSGAGTPPPPPPTAANLVVRARADLAQGTGAIMEVRVGGTLIATTEVTAQSYQDYAYPVPAIAPGTRVDVTFTNDYWDPGVADRNLYVERITVNGTTAIAATDPSVVLDRGSGAAAFDGQDTGPGQEGVWSPGSLRFTVPGTAPPPPVPVIAETEPNDTRATAQRLSLPVTVDARMPSRNDDWFAIPVPAGRTLTVRLTPPANADYDLRLTNASGTQLAASTLGTGRVDTVTWRNAGSTTATVYARAYYYSGAFAAYRLELF